MKDGKIVRTGDSKNRYSFTIISDDHGKSWRIGSKQVQPYHTTECSVAQSFDGGGDLYMYTRIWGHLPGEARRGIARSTDGGETWDNATLRGLGDTAPDCEGSMISARLNSTTCFFVSSPWSTSRANLTVQSSCGSTAPAVWSTPVVVRPNTPSAVYQGYSSLAATADGALLVLFDTNECLAHRPMQHVCGGLAITAVAIKLPERLWTLGTLALAP